MKEIKYFYNQNKYKDTIKDAYDRANTKEIETIATSGCGVCSATMAVNNLIEKELFTPNTMATFSINNGARGQNGTIMVTLLKAICNKYTDFSFKTTEKGDDVVEHLKNGGVAIIHQGNTKSTKAQPLFSTGGHYVFAYGLDDKNNVKVADPAYTSTRYDTIYRKSHIVSKTNTGCVADIKEINKATTPTSYYLISYSGKKATEQKKTITTTTTKQTTKKTTTYKKSTSVPYVVGKVYTLQTDVRVRKSASTAEGTQKKRSELSANAKKNSKLGVYAVLKKGTKVTCKKVVKKGNDIWIEIPSGYVAGYYNGKILIK